MRVRSWKKYQKRSDLSFLYLPIACLNILLSIAIIQKNKIHVDIFDCLYENTCLNMYNIIELLKQFYIVYLCITDTNREVKIIFVGDVGRF